MKYRIDFTEGQIHAVQRACEFYSRFLAGQWEIPDAMQYKEYMNQCSDQGFWTKRNYIEDQLRILSSQLTTMSSNASYGVGSDKMHEDGNICYDIYRPILEEFNRDSDNIYSHPGLTYSVEGRIKVEKIE